jgi:hypothetical protein
VSTRPCPGSVCVPAGGPVVPSRALARRGTVRCSAGGKGEEEERREAESRVPHVSDRNEKAAVLCGRWAASDGLLGWARCGLAGSAGCSQGKMPTSEVSILQRL